MEFKDPDNIFERRADIADRLYDLSTHPPVGQLYHYIQLRD